MKYQVVKGNVIDHEFNPAGSVVICHCCNDIGIAGAGVALAIVQKWPHINKEYRDWYDYDEYIGHDGELCHCRMRLGDVQFLEADQDIYIANMIGQKDIGHNEFGQPPVRLDSLLECLYRLRKFIIKNNIKSVAAPMFASLRAGASWEDVLELIHKVFDNVNVEWYTYEFVEQPTKGRNQV